MPGSRASLRATRSCLADCACSSVDSAVGYTAQVYAIDGPSTHS